MVSVLRALGFVFAGLAVCVGSSRVALRKFPRHKIAGSRSFAETRGGPGSSYNVSVSGADSDGQEFRLTGTCQIGAKGFYPDKPCGPPLHIHEDAQVSPSLHAHMCTRVHHAGIRPNMRPFPDNPPLKLILNSLQVPQPGHDAMTYTAILEAFY